MIEFFHMGGYAAYVWPAYGIAGLILIWLAVQAARSVRINRKTLTDLEARVSRRRNRDGSP